MSFSAEEIRRIEDTECLLLGIQPSELAQMSQQMKYDLLALANAKKALAQGKFPT